MPCTPNMPLRARDGATRVPPSGTPSSCSSSPSAGASPPVARWAAVSGPLASAEECSPPVGSAPSLEVPDVSLIYFFFANLTDDGTSSVLWPDSASAAARLAPKGSSMILACSLRIASINISGRGGQPGR